MDRTKELENKINELELKLIKKDKIQKVLMDRIEKSINSSGNAYTLFENNIVLHKQVEKRTEELLRANTDNEVLIRKLQKALDEVKELSGLLPICSYCKNIRNDDGYWQAIELYILDHSTAQFSHGICNKCLEENHPDIYRKMQEEKK